MNAGEEGGGGGGGGGGGEKRWIINYVEYPAYISWLNNLKYSMTAVLFLAINLEEHDDMTWYDFLETCKRELVSKLTTLIVETFISELCFMLLLM